ncbi:acyltransferase family protein [Thalassococcus halodurans]|uniref:acyltransferase family protein n=1 Tax=Thalassococcus halodurans TaxID=373675 RepID=UPI00135A30DC|nr:acyltransferase family protein [Thalassococcus halodurans]
MSAINAATRSALDRKILLVPESQQHKLTAFRQNRFSQVQYRADIDGLRAIAVLLVIAYHFGLTQFSGGYLGVDVFFVISGFLITSQILSQIERGQFRFADFYARRARRILPALFAVVGSSLVAGYILLLPLDLKALGEQAMYAVFGVSNFYFLSETGYFSKEAHQLPLLHTWSLGVEEQFYLIWPLICVATLSWLKLSARLNLAVLFVLCAASFAWLLLNRGTNPEFSFFMLPTRAWQLGLGAMIAFAPSVSKRGLSEVQVLIGLALILASATLTTADDKTMEYGIIGATVGAGLIVWPKGQNGWADRLLSITPLVGVGKISYSAYLWHWPLFVFFIVWNSGAMPDGHDIAVLALVTLALSYLSYRFIETPFRQRKDSSFWVLAVAFSIATAIGLLGFFLFKNEGVPGRLSAENQLIAEYLERKKVKSKNYACSFPDFDRNELEIKCLDEDRFGVPVLLMGDSHAHHFQAALRNRYPEAYFHIASYSLCLPLLGGTPNKEKSKNSRQCAEIYRHLFDGLLTEGRYKTIILSARWKNNDWSKIESTVKYLKQFADEVIVFGPTLEYVMPLPSLLLADALPRRSTQELRNSYTKQDLLKEIDASMKELVVTQGGTYYSLLDLLCAKTSDECISVDETGIPLAWDYGHLTYEGANFILKGFEEQGLRLP